MAQDINSVVIIGRLTRDAEMKTIPSGQVVAELSIASNRSVKKGDHWETEASFFDVTLWGKQASALQTYLTKGQQIGVAGELRQQRWVKDGQHRSKVVINANNIQLLGSKPQQQAGKQEPEPQGEYFDDDVPF